MPSNVDCVNDFSDIFSGYQALSGILQQDPARLAAGAGATAIGKLYRHLNNPNRIVKNLFKDVESILLKQAVTPTTAGKELIGRTVGYTIEEAF